MTFGTMTAPPMVTTYGDSNVTQPEAGVPSRLV